MRIGAAVERGGLRPPHPREIAAAGLLLAVFGLSACIEVAPPRGVTASDVKVSEGVGLEAACTPTGVEQCFDARDNNCNGVIDEGCGVHTGILQFTAAWEAADANVDLDVTDATGEMARTGGEPTAGGLKKDRDCPKPNGECMGQNVENVFLAEGEPKLGKYKVVVRLQKLNGATPPVKVRLGVRVGQRSIAATMELAPGPGTEEKTFDFRL